MRRRVRNVPPIRWPARGCPGEGARQAAQGQLLCAGPSTAPPSPRSRDVTARPCGASLPPAPARLGHRQPPRTDSAPRYCRVPSSCRLSQPGAACPYAAAAATRPLPGRAHTRPRDTVRARSSSSAPAGPRRKPALGPPRRRSRRRLSSVRRAAGPDQVPIGPARRPSQPARLRAGGLFPAEARARAAPIVAVS